MYRWSPPNTFTYYYCRPSLTDPGGMSFYSVSTLAPAQVPGHKTVFLKAAYSIAYGLKSVQ